MSAGRCQTPALNLVYENDKANRKEKMVYDVFGYFTSKHIKFTLKDNLEDPQDFEKCETHTFIYNFTCPKPIVKNPPKNHLLQVPFNKKPIMYITIVRNKPWRVVKNYMKEVILLI